MYYVASVRLLLDECLLGQLVLINTLVRIVVVDDIGVLQSGIAEHAVDFLLLGLLLHQALALLEFQVVFKFLYFALSEISQSSSCNL